jgi:site-specific DNA recombinase
MIKARKQAQPVENEALRVAAYIRVSTEEQAESGLGIAAQIDKVRAMAVVKGWSAPTLYIDDGVSGMIAIANRPEGERLLTDIDAGKIDAVIVSALDRIGRRALYILTFIDDTKDSIQLVSVKESIDTSTPAGKFMVTVMAGIAELERDTISERTKSALEARGKSVGIRSGLPPYAYRYEDREVYVVEEQAIIVRRVYDLRGTGLTLRAIADRIEEETGIHIGFNTVKVILDREAVYRGCQRGESEHTWPVVLNVA